MRRSLEDAVKNVFEETTMKNVPIDQFWSFKWRNRVWNWNLRKKTEQDRPFQKFWFLVKGQRKKSKSPGPRSNSTNIRSRSVSGFPGRSRIGLLRRWLILMTWRWRGLGLTWTCLRGCWHGVITSSSDIRWHQQQCFGAWQERAMFTSAWRKSPILGRHFVACLRSNGGQNLRFCRSVDEEADRAVHVTKEDLPVRIPMWRMGDILELTAARGGAWLGFGWPDF